jgi:hypothetical protein
MSGRWIDTPSVGSMTGAVSATDHLGRICPGSRGGHFFTINRKPNRTEILVFGSSVFVFVSKKFGFRYRN